MTNEDSKTIIHNAGIHVVTPRRLNAKKTTFYKIKREN